MKFRTRIKRSYIPERENNLLPIKEWTLEWQLWMLTDNEKMFWGKVLRENYFQARILYPVNIPSKCNSKIKTFSQICKTLWKFTSCAFLSSYLWVSYKGKKKKKEKQAHIFPTMYTSISSRSKIVPGTRQDLHKYLLTNMSWKK